LNRFAFVVIVFGWPIVALYSSHAAFSAALKAEGTFHCGSIKPKWTKLQWKTRATDAIGDFLAGSSDPPDVLPRR
jgi:hypothetical protein